MWAKILQTLKEGITFLNELSKFTLFLLKTDPVFSVIFHIMFYGVLITGYEYIYDTTIWTVIEDLFRGLVRTVDRALAAKVHGLGQVYQPQFLKCHLANSVKTFKTPGVEWGVSSEGVLFVLEVKKNLLYEFTDTYIKLTDININESSKIPVRYYSMADIVVGEVKVSDIFDKSTFRVRYVYRTGGERGMG
jgi:hypothetical protein